VPKGHPVPPEAAKPELAREENRRQAHDRRKSLTRPQKMIDPRPPEELSFDSKPKSAREENRRQTHA
jgi:hypothetical protein